MTSIVLGLLTAVVFAASSLIAARASRIISPVSVVAWAMAIGLVLTVPMIGLTYGGAPNLDASVTWLVIAGGGNVTGLVLAASAFRIGKVGVVAPILASEGAIAALISAWMGENIAPMVAIALVWIAFGVVVAGIAPDPQPIRGERRILSALLALSAAGVFGICLYAVGHLSSDVPAPWLLLPARVFGVVFIFVPLVVTRRLQMTREALPLVAVLGVTEIAGLTLFALAAQGQIAVAAVLASQFAPLAAIFAYFFWGERLGRLQIAGVAVIAVGVGALIALTRIP